jgi:hypothetical protein
VLCLVNAERTSRNLPAVSADDRLALAAQRHTDDMLTRDYFAHEEPMPMRFGLEPGDRVTAAGYAWSETGENIAAGQATPREVMGDWMASTGHCHNILSPGVSQLGVGISPGAATLPGQTGATWTQEFGNPLTDEPPSGDERPRAGCPYATLAPDSAAGQPGPQPHPGSSSSSPAGSAGETPSAARAQPLAISAHLTRSRLAVSGTVDPTVVPGKVTVIVRVAGRTYRRVVRVARARFRVRVRVPARARRVVVRVIAGPLSVQRAVR